MSKADNLQKLILGTAQFGLDYGISNTRGQLTQEEVETILIQAFERGITTLDTATAYGESEESIGMALYGKGSFNIITKYPPNQPGLSIKQAFEESLKRLNQESIYGYLLHSFSTYQNNPTVLEELQDLKVSGKVKKIGVSLYHPHEALALLEANAPIDIVQLPYSVFDRRFESVFHALNKAGIETHVRSIYLQGLYFMQPNQIPVSLKNAVPKVTKLHALANQYSIPLGAMLMGFALHNKCIDKVVIGIESLQTLEDNISFCNFDIPENLIQELQNFEEQDENIILPYKWPKA